MKGVHYFLVLITISAMAEGAARFKLVPLPAEDLCPTLLSSELVAEIRDHQGTADLIMDFILNGKYRGKTYQEVADFVDKHPVRFAGFQNLEDSLDYLVDRLKNTFELENVRAEPVEVPVWVRGEEKAQMLEPLQKKLRILGLGPSVGTPRRGITAEVLVVTSFEDLENKKDEASGKIVVYNQPFVDYFTTYKYRKFGASAAAQYGALAALIRSVTPISINSPHAGGQTYWENITAIPGASITVEDAELMGRLQGRGEKITVFLKMLDETLPETSTSRNIVAELRGSDDFLQNQFVAVSGHSDNWDVGQGAMDDASGCMVSVVAVSAIKELNLRPKRTLQAILWSSEEPGMFGVSGYVKDHMDIMANYSAVFESDDGIFEPRGFDFAGSEYTGCIVKEILQLTKAMNTTFYQRLPDVASDIIKMTELGVPGLSLNTVDDMYWSYHHTEGDSVSLLDPREADKATALWAVASFVIANLTDQLTREPSIHDD